MATAEQKETIKRACQNYQQRMEDIFEEEIWGLAMALGLEEEEVEAIWNEAV